MFSALFILSSLIESIEAEKSAAFLAPALPMANVATGMPPGICTIESKLSMPLSALLSMGNGTYFIMVNATLRKKLKLTFGSVLQVKLKEDTSKYGIPMPEEMAELLQQDKVVDTLFHSLTPGKQRSLLYLIGVPKTTESRIKKAVLISRYLVEVEGKLDFREMNEYIKANNKLF